MLSKINQGEEDPNIVVNRNNIKKTEEWVIMELFREQCREFPKGMLSASESPDFILSLGPRNKIGIELTRLHQHPPGTDPFSPENISACLLQKEDKLRLYRMKKLREYWLVFFVRDHAFIPPYNLHNKLVTWTFGSGYDRIFIFHLKNRDIFELKRSERS